MPLTIIQPGRMVRFVSVDAGHGLQGRLASMGLIPGVEIEVIQNTPHGPFLISVMGGKIMLGRGMAQKIRVQ